MSALLTTLTVLAALVGIGAAIYALVIWGASRNAGKKIAADLSSKLLSYGAQGLGPSAPGEDSLEDLDDIPMSAIAADEGAQSVFERTLEKRRSASGPQSGKPWSPQQ